MAPMLVARDAATKPSTNVLSPLLPVLYLGHSPKRSTWNSILRSSPTREPSTSDMTIMAVCPLTSLPSTMLSIPLSAPASPMKITATAVDFMRES